jgi:MFS transporter, DHA1 family, putative efflux transporter
MPTGATSWAAVGMLAVATFVVGTSELVIAGVLPVVAGDLRINVATAGYLVTAYAMSFAVATPLVAAGVGGVSRRAMLVGCLAVFVVGTALSAVAPTFEWLLVSRVVTAAAAGVFEVVATAAAATLVQTSQRGRAIALVVAGFSVALLIGVPIGTLIGNAWGWRATFGVLLAPALLVAFGIAVWLPAVPRLQPAALSILRAPGLIPALAATGLVFCGTYIATTFIAVLLEDISGLTPDGVAGVLLLLGLGSIVGNAFGGYAIDHWGSERSSLAGGLGAALALGLLSFGAPLAVVALAACTIMGTSLGVFVPAQQARLVHIGGAAPELSLALNLATLNAGISLGAAVGSALVDRGGLAVLGYVGAVVGMLAVALVAGTTSRT